MRNVAFCSALAIFSCVLLFGQVHETVIYNVGTNPGDGDAPSGKLVFDAEGNIYGTLVRNSVFVLSPTNGSWNESLLYTFCSEPNCADGTNPSAGVIFDKSGNLYGTTLLGGAYGCGTLFELKPLGGSAWEETTIWTFGATSDDGCHAGPLTLDISGNIFASAGGGGLFGGGVVFELSPPLVQGGSWTETILYSFCQNEHPPNCSDGSAPSELVFDSSGNLYGTTRFGGTGCADSGCGTIFELSPIAGGWIHSIIYHFSKKNGYWPLSGLTVDKGTNLYGTVSAGGTCCGGVYRLSRKPNGQWVESVASVNFSSASPSNGVILDGISTAYGTSALSGLGQGTFFQIDSTNERTLYNFCSQPNCIDGALPSGTLTYRQGKVYGPAQEGGTFNRGVIFEISR